MNKVQNENLESDDSKKFIVIGPSVEPGLMLKTVIEKVLIEKIRPVVGPKMDSLIFLVGQAAGPINEAVEIMEKDPSKKLIIIDPFGLNKLGITIDAQAGFSRLSKFNYVKTIKEMDDFWGEITAAINEFNDAEKKNKGTSFEGSFRVTELQQEYSEKVLRYLQHDLPKAIKGKPEDYIIVSGKEKDFERLMKVARDAFGMKSRVTEKQVIEFIMNTNATIIKVMSGEISGVYCDIDDTILNKDGKVIKSSLELIKKLEKEGYPIIIWTGGDLEIAKKKLSKTPFKKYEIVSKYDYSGVEAEIIIDNVSPEKFAIQTGITAKRFIRV